MKTRMLLTMSAAVCCLRAAVSPAAPVARYDFTKGTHGWKGNHHTADLRVTSEGLALRSTGNDPWLTSPPVALPATGRVRFSIRMRSSAGGPCRLFWGAKGFTEDRAQNVAVPADGQFHEASVVFQAAAGRMLLRFDPGTQEGPVTIAWVAAEFLPAIKAPPAPKSVRPTAGKKPPLTLTAGDLVLAHYGRRWGGFVLSVEGTEMASGHVNGRLACELDGKAVFIPLEKAEFSVRRDADAIVERAILRDPLAGTWTLTRRFAAGAGRHIAVDMSLAVHESARLVHYPWLTLFPGLGTFGSTKTQALLPGVEYLANEPSSSKADLTTAAHLRRIPDPHKLCFPLVAFCHQGRCLSLRWRRSEHVALVHDSPDRIFDSGAHMVGLWAPNVGAHRLENDLFALDPVPLEPGVPLRAAATIHGYRGKSVVPAISDYVTTARLPELPRLPGGYEQAVELMAAGWTRSSGYDGAGGWKHAVWNRWDPQPAADACAFALRLSQQTRSDETRRRLLKAVETGLERARAADANLSGGVSHIRPPAAPFVFGDVAAYLRARKRGAHAELKRFEKDGSRPYHRREGKPDYASTHFAGHANGHGAATVSGILGAALLTGDRELAAEAVALLDKQTVLYANTVPRGAQSWEVPLHTPDILASAYLVSAYVAGYRLTGRRDLLEQAVYWAWTGVPFIYLDRSTGGEIGDYATIPVLGATNWRAPLWIGLPVQWCGRVYASALEDLAPLDPDGPWNRLARGITASALQQSWLPPDERQGLLPDFFNIATRHRDGPAINPGTTQSGMPFLYNKDRFFDTHICHETGWIAHAPGTIRNAQESPDGLRFELDGWGTQPYSILLSRVDARPTTVTVAEQTAGVEYHAEEHWLVVGGIKGAATIEVRR